SLVPLGERDLHATYTGSARRPHTNVGSLRREDQQMDIHFNDTQELVVERRYEGSASPRSAWTIHPVDASHSTLTIDAFQSMGPVRGLAIRPFLKNLFYGINFTPFIRGAKGARQRQRPNGSSELASWPGRSPGRWRGRTWKASRSTR